MKVVHIESGLGNQMLSYCELLALQYANPGETIYIETLAYDCPECSKVVSQWYGYELERIFGLTPPNISSLFDAATWAQIVEEVRATEWWKHRWNYPVAFTDVLARHGLVLDNVRGDFSTPPRPTLRSRLRKSKWYYKALVQLQHVMPGYFRRPDPQLDLIYLHTDRSVFTGNRLAFRSPRFERHRIDAEIRRSFVFPAWTDERNAALARQLEGRETVFIHARRGDMLSWIGWCYEDGFFARAVRHIRHRVERPLFVFFTNTDSVEWCKANPKVFGLDFNRDEVIFVDWNKGQESFRDLQLMTHCKHGILTESTFGWWGATLIDYPHKITIAPAPHVDVTTYV